MKCIKIIVALIIGAVYRKLEFSGDTIVSYSGGLFHAGDFILKPLVRKLEENGICLCPPKYSPVQGAALLAAREYSRDGEFLSRIKADMMDRQSEKGFWLYEIKNC